MIRRDVTIFVDLVEHTLEFDTDTRAIKVIASRPHGTPEPPREPAESCRDCENGPIVRWPPYVGPRWYGLPRPLRWLLPAKFNGKDVWRGCGCPVLTKDLWLRYKAWRDELRLHPAIE